MVAEMFLFYHPVAWWTSKRRVVAPSAAMGNTDGALLYRIQRLLDGAPRNHGPSRWSGVMAICVGLACGALEVTWVRAQSPTPARPQFEVASIKTTKFSPGLMGVKFLTGGRVHVDQSPLILLITTAYSISQERVEFPTSLHAVDEFYNIDARASSSAIAPGASDREARRQAALMLQSLLEERFKLRFHHETKERPALALLLGKSGPRFPKAADRDCAETLSAPSPCNVFPGGPARGAAGKTVTLSDLAGYLSLFMGQLVLDRTGLSGTFDIDLPPWSRGTETGQRAADDGREPVSDASSPSIFAVMQDLGLRLESSKARVDILVIDHVEKPTEN